MKGGSNSYDAHALGMIMTLSAMVVTCLVTSNAAAVKLIALPFNYAASVSVVSYLLALLALDLTNEFFGKWITQRLVYLGFISLAISAGLLQVFVVLPPASGWNGQQAYHSTFYPIPRILLAGWAAFLVSQMSGVHLFAKITSWIPHQAFWVRKTLSDSCNQALDTSIFILGAFGWDEKVHKLLFGQYLIKLALLLLEAPLAQLLARAITKWLPPFADEAKHRD
jgi:uncharacterized integral membrane protein (TIGR00697 family)